MCCLSSLEAVSESGLVPPPEFFKISLLGDALALPPNSATGRRKQTDIQEWKYYFLKNCWKVNSCQQRLLSLIPWCESACHGKEKLDAQPWEAHPWKKTQKGNSLFLLPSQFRVSVTSPQFWSALSLTTLSLVWKPHLREYICWEPP